MQSDVGSGSAVKKNEAKPKLDPLLVTDPWQELQSERNRHDVTLTHIKSVLRLMELPSAWGTPMTEFCRLCYKQHTERRAHCPHLWLAGYVRTQVERLRRKVRRPTGAVLDPVSVAVEDASTESI
jgi:hypothetical protein